MGKIHLGRQNLNELQTRKMKGLKRSRDVEEEGDVMDEDIVSQDSEDVDDDEGGVQLKRLRAE